MDRRWPWKKKSSDKAVVDKAAPALDSTLASAKGNQKSNYVKISVESYSHLTGLEDQVKSYEEKIQTYEEKVQKLEDEIKEMNEKLSAANSEINTKENMIKQHAKVSEEASSGWEKAEAEALALKNHIESVTLLKLTAEDRASHLDGALKDCMWQIRNLKEEHEQNIQDIALSKTKQLDKIKGELEAKITNFEQELLRSSAENAALSRSLQEHSNMLIKIREEKARAEAQIELLKSNIEACERENNSLKYELHVVSKELEIRNEEKNMSMRSAEAANKQHMEGVKKIAKLESECQRLRSLVRKKLPGPAALAQMKLEVEHFGRDNNVQKFQKENVFLSERLLAMEEETKMLKEALAKCNTELQASRSMCAKTMSKLQSFEAQLQTSNQHKGSPKSIIQITKESIYSQNASNAPSLVAMTEDENDDAGSCAESWSTTNVSGLSQFTKEKSIEESSKSEATKRLELMDDFLEVEKLAHLSNDDSNLDSTVSVSSNNKTTDIVIDNASEVNVGKEGPSEKNGDSNAACDRQDNPKDVGLNLETKIISSQQPKEYVHITSDLEAAIIQIHEFVLILGKETMAFHDISSDGNEMSQKTKEFSVTFKKVLCNNASLVQFVLDLSHVLAIASDFRFNVLGYKCAEAETNSPDCIDKIALPENKLVQENASRERYQNGGSLILSPGSDPGVPDDGNVVSGYNSNAASQKLSMEEFEELKLEKEKAVTDLSRCTENLEMTRSQLQETEQLLAEVKSQLTSAKKSDSLAETQLKCMAESYESLEKRAQEFEAELNRLQIRTKTLENELQDEKSAHEAAMVKSKELEEHLQRLESSAADNDLKPTQKKDLAAAAEKLVECQETIFLLGKQLNALRPQTELVGSPNSKMNPKVEGFIEDGPTTSTSRFVQRPGSESPLHFSDSLFSPSDTELNLPPRSPVRHSKPKHRPTKSASCTPTPERHARRFSRFFSSKGKPAH